VLDSSGAARAVLQSGRYSKDEGIHLLEETYKDLLTPEVPQLASFAFASNLACVHGPFESGERSLPQACTEVRVLAKQPLDPVLLLRPETIAPLQAEVQKSVEEWSGEIFRRFRWKVPALALAGSSKLQPTPECIPDLGGWIKNYRRGILRWLPGVKDYPKEAEEKLSLPSRDLKLELNALGQVILKVSNPNAVSAILNFNPRQLDKEGKGSFTLRIGGEPSQTIVLQKCSN